MILEEGILALSILIVAKALSLQKDGAAISEDTEEQMNYRLPNNIEPLHYEIKLALYVTEDNNTFDGDVAIELVIRRATQDIIFHKYQLEIEEDSTILLQESDTGIEAITPASYSYDNNTQMLKLHFNRSLEPNLYTLSIKFTGSLSDEQKGIFRCSYTDDNGTEMWMVVTHFEPTNARRAFPCFDEPAQKATFNISIQHYDNYTALSNMPILSSSPVNDEPGKVWTKFEKTPIMSTYLVAFVVGDFANISSPDGINNVWARKDLIENGRLNLETATTATRVLEAYTNTSFRMPKMDHVAVVQYPSGAMENWGLIIYPEGSLLYNSSQDTSRKMRVIEVAVHELAHQWFGNVVSPSWWSYTWLNEAFAAYFQRYIVDQIMDAKWTDYFVVTTQQFALEDDCTSDGQPITINVTTPSDAASAFSSITYSKGASILRMLSHFLSEDVLRDGLVRYIDSYQYKAATPSDLWNTIQSVLNESDIAHDEYTVAETMTTWTDQIGYPLVNVDRDYDSGKVTLTQNVFRPRYYSFVYDEEDGEENKENDAGKQEMDDTEKESDKWWIPVRYTTQTDADFSNTLPSVWMKPHENNTTIDGINDSDWIILNLQQTGYYRVNYDRRNWLNIAKYLNSDNYTNIHPLNRAQILDDSFILLKAGQLDPIVYAELTNYLSRESDIIPWIPAFRVLDSFQPYILHPGIFDILKPHILKLMESVIDSVGFVERPDDNEIVKMHRDSVISWACMMGNSVCKEKVIEKAIAYWRDPKRNNIGQDFKYTVLCEGFREVNESVWNEFESRIQEGKDFDLSGITCAGNDFVIKSIINIIMKKYSIESPDDIQSIIFMRLPRTIPAQNVMLDYILENCNKIETMHSNSAVVQILAETVITTRVHTTKQLNKAKTLIKTCGIHVDEDKLNAVESKVKKIEQEILILQNCLQKLLAQANSP